MSWRVVLCFAWMSACSPGEEPDPGLNVDVGTTWSSIETVPNPGRRELPALAYDEDRQRVVLFGGSEDLDTWEYDGAGWVAVSGKAKPELRIWHRMVYDVARKQIVMFGGLQPPFQSRIPSNKTWLFTGTGWREITDIEAPPARYFHAMVYDRARERVVLYGGLDEAGDVLEDTWEWDGEAWTEIVSPRTPGFLASAIVFDEKRNTTIAFVLGMNGTGEWAFDGVTWKGVGALDFAGLSFKAAYDTARGTIVAFGGADLDRGDISPQTWERLGDGKWIKIRPKAAPGGRLYHDMVYDRAREKVVLYGDSFEADTWEYGRVSVAP
jgi:hypothetical protein